MTRAELLELVRLAEQRQAMPLGMKRADAAEWIDNLSMRLAVPLARLVVEAGRKFRDERDVDIAETGEWVCPGCGLTATSERPDVCDEDCTVAPLVRIAEACG